MTAISIILPVYNSQEYLFRCLDALMNQTMKDVEFLCVDDGSTDASGKILDEYAQRDSRFRVFHRPNSGPSLSRNFALSNAGGKYIMFCDSDDWYEPNMCEKMYHTIEKNDVDFVMCNTHVIIQNMRDKNLPANSWYFPFQAGRYTLNTSILSELNIFLWNKIFRRELLTRFQLVFPSIQRGDDDYFSRCYFFASQSFICIDEKLYHYRIRAHSIMDEFAKNAEFRHKLDYITVYELCYLFLVRHNLFEKNRDLFFVQFQNAICWLWTNIPIAKKKEFINRIRLFINNTGFKGRVPKSCRVLYNLFENRNLKAINKLDGIPSSLIKLYIRSIQYMILSHISWGKCRRYYMLNRKIIKYKIELYRKRNKENLNIWKNKNDDALS